MHSRKPVTSFCHPGYGKAKQVLAPKQFKGMHFIMLLARSLWWYKITGLVYMLVTPVELPGSTLLSNKLCYYLYPRRVDCIIINEMQFITAPGAQVSQGLKTESPSCRLNYVTAPLPQLLLWNLRKTLYYKRRANESSQGRRAPKEK